MKIFVSATTFCRCNKLQKIKRVRLVAATKTFGIHNDFKIFTKKFYSTHEAICRCDVSPQNVAANCRLVCTDLNVQVMYRNPCKSLTKSCMLRE